MIHAFLLSALLSFVPAHRAPAKVPLAARACTLAQFRDAERPDSAHYFVAMATRDSVFIGEVFFGDSGMTLVKPVKSAESRRVYGQVAVVRKVGGFRNDAPKAGDRVVLVWWTYLPSCARYFPDRAINIPPTQEVFLSTRRSSVRRIDGMTVYDTGWADLGTNQLWVPALQAKTLNYHGRTPVRVEVMTAAEYFQMFAKFPLVSTARADWRASGRAFLEWADSHKRISRKYPACEIVSTLRTNITAPMGPLRLPDDCET